MPGTTRPSFAAILAELRRHEVDFIVVGGVAAVLEGVPATTFDLDIVHSREPDNIARLLAALKSLDATYRSRPEQRFGPLDVLGVIGRSRGHDNLMPHTQEVEVDEGLVVRALNLETLIAVKEEVGSERDMAVLPIMRRTLEEKRRG